MPRSGQGTRRSSKDSRPRAKHVPQRTCVVCRETGAKRGLTRIVRTGEGEIEVDPSGRMNGRGAYLCEKRDCWDQAMSTPILNKALRTTLNEESMEKLKEFAAGASLFPILNGTAANSEEQAL